MQKKMVSCCLCLVLTIGLLVVPQVILPMTANALEGFPTFSYLKI
jgi:hypothetical protein